MRGAVGLIALLAGIGVIVWLWSTKGGHPVNTVRQGQNAAKQVEDMAPSGANVLNPGRRDMPKPQGSIVLEPNESGGQVRYVLVKSLTPDGTMERAYGLKVNDRIIQAGNDPFASDGTAAMLTIFEEGFNKHLPLKVKRDGQEMDLKWRDPQK